MMIFVAIGSPTIKERCSKMKVWVEVWLDMNFVPWKWYGRVTTNEVRVLHETKSFDQLKQARDKALEYCENHDLKVTHILSI